MIKIQDVLRAGHIKRWNIINTTRQQTLAEHLFNVAMIADTLMNELGQYEYRDIILAWALQHDIPEVVCGDTPTPTKRRIEEMGFDMEIIYDEIDPTYKATKETALEVGFGMSWKIVKASDLIEAIHFLTENGVGIHAKNVANTLHGKFTEFVELNFSEHQYEGVYKVFNQVMSEEIYE